MLLQISFEGDLVHAWPLIRTAGCTFQNRWASLSKISKEGDRMTSISILLLLTVKKGTPSNPIFSVTPKNSGKLHLRLTARLAIYLTYSFWHLPWGLYLSPAFLTDMKLCPTPLIFFKYVKEEKKDEKAKLANIFPVNNENKTRKTVPWWIEILNIKHVISEVSNFSNMMT